MACTETLDGVKSIKLNKMPDVYELGDEVRLELCVLTVEFDKLELNGWI